MKLGQVGEEKAISWISSFLGRPRGVPVGVGDDAAVIRVGDSRLAVCSDMIQEGSHIYKGMTAYQAGRKAAVVNLSDLASMGAEPRAFLMSVSISEKSEFSYFKDIFRGADSACEEAGASFIGGDLNRGGKLILDGFAVGEIKEKPLRRTGARIGDIVAVTGYLGSAACGWQILEKGLDLKRFSVEERERINRNIVKACLEPRARVREGRLMAKSGYVTSCTDISDGLAFSLGYMRDGYGFEIYEDRIPLRKEFGLVCKSFGLDEDLLKYHIGEDFELLCTVKAKKFEELREKIPGLKAIGRVVGGRGIRLVGEDGSGRNLKPVGYNHFNKQSAVRKSGKNP